MMMATACGAPAPEANEPTAVDTTATTPVSEAGPTEPTANRIDWQGHRGARGLRPENTLPAFELALDLGVDTLELDLHLSADDQVVVWHDPVIEASKCEGDGVGTAVRRLTAAELRALRCATNPDPDTFPDQAPEPGTLSGDDFGIVTLTELFRFVDEYSRSADKNQQQRTAAMAVRLNIETKRRPDDPSAIDDRFDGSTMGLFEQAVVEAVDDAAAVDRVTVQSFDHRSLWAIGAARPDITLVALTGRNQSVDLADLATRGAAVWSPDHRTLDVAAIAEAHELDLRVIPWTVNDPHQIDRLIEAGVDGIITDRPDRRPPVDGNGG